MTLLMNLRYGLRQLRQAPGFALAAVVTLALGIGANTAMFSLLDQAILRALPVRNPQELVVLRGTGKVWEGSTSNWGGSAESYFSYPMYRDLRDRDGAFQGLLATVPAEVNFVRPGSNARILNVELVSGNYFSVLGVAAAAGRVLLPGDDTQPDANPVAVMSYDFWRNEMGGAASAIGSTVTLNGHPFQLIGVSAPGFQSAAWGKTPGLFLPLSMSHTVSPGWTDRLTNRQNRWLSLLGRLQPQETVAQAEVQSAPRWHALRAEELKAMGSRSPYFIGEFLTRSRLLVLPAASGFSYDRDTYRAPLFAVMSMAALVLLIAVVNVGSLLLVRAAGRVREFSMRHALGASGSRILGQLLAEGLLLGVAGGMLGVLLAPLATHAVASRLLDSGTAIFSSAIDARVLAFNFIVAVAASVLFSMAPAVQLRREHLSLALRQTAGTNSKGLLAVRRIIVGLQVGLSLLLLVGAGLFVRTVQRLRTANVGFRTDHLVSFSLAPALVGYTKPQIPALRHQLRDALTSIPSVQQVGITTDPELAGLSSTTNFSFENHPQSPDRKPDVELAWASQGYFSTLQTPLVAGRDFTAADDLQHPLVAIVNESLARLVYGSPQQAVGQRLMQGSRDSPVFNIEIVGVVRDTRHADLRSLPLPSVFECLAQNADPNYRLFFYLRSATDPASILHSIRQRVSGVDPGLAIQELRTMDEQIDSTVQNERLIALLATSFGILAAVLAGVGLYGVLAFITAQRTREIGVRMALGATRASVSKLVLSDVLKLTVAGIVVAIPVAILLARLLQSQLFEIAPTDPVSLIGAVILLAVVALTASALPARRAASVNPTQALRTE